MSEESSSTTNFKQQVANSFGNAASYYDTNASIQQEVADRLIASLKPWRDIIPAGPIIELGCGTGFVTEGLAALYPDRDIEAIDLAEGMIEFCNQKCFDYKNVCFYVHDAEQIPYDTPHYAMTVSGFTAHWFKYPAQILARWLEITKPGGLLLASFPGNESFPEWKNHCLELGLPFTANKFPDVEEMVIKMSLGPAQVDYYEDTVVRTFDSAKHFFEDLRNLGMVTRRQGRTLSVQERSLLIDHWDASAEDEVTVSYHIIFLAVKRDFES